MANFNNNLLNYKKITSLSNTSLEYEFEKISSKVENVIKIVFAGSFSDNIETAYDPATVSGFALNYLNTNTRYICKQLNQNGEVSAVGIVLRFIPGDKEQTLYLKVIEGTFNTTNGVIFSNSKDANGVALTEATQIANTFSYGSSIKEVRDVLNAQKITCYYDTTGSAALHYSNYTAPPAGGTFNGDPEYHYDYGEFPSSGTVRIIKANGANFVTQETEFTTGKILAKIVATGTVSLIIEMNEKLDQDISLDPANGKDYDNLPVVSAYYVEELQTIPCARYKIDFVETLSSTANSIQEISFSDNTLNNSDLNFEYIPTIPGESYNKVIQYKFDQTILVDGVETAVSIEANVIAWDAVAKRLYIQCITSPFAQRYGKIYQLNTNGGSPNISSLGGNGFSSQTDTTLKTGIFVNISNTYDPTLGNFDSGTRVIQQIDELSNWYPDLNYTVGEEVRQYINGTQYRTATVLSWYNPKTVAEALISPPTLSLKLDSDSTLLELRPTASNYSTYADKILPSSVSIEDKDNWKYSLSESLVLGKNVIANANQYITTEPELELVTKRNAASNNIQSNYYAYGAKAAPLTFGKCVIRYVTNEPLAGNQNTFKISLFDIKPESTYTFDDIFEYGNSLLDNNGKTLFEVTPESYKTIKYSWSDTPYPVQLNEINEGDVLYSSSDELLGTVVSVVRKDGNSSLIIERLLTNTVIYQGGDKIKTAYKYNATYSYTLSSELDVNNPIPYQGLYLLNPTKNGLVRNLQNGRYFEKVKEGNTVQACEFVKCYTISSLTTSSIVLDNAFPLSSLSGSGNVHEIIYKNSNGAIVTGSFSSSVGGALSINGNQLSFDMSKVSTNITPNTRALVRLRVSAALTGFARNKNLETQTDTRKINARTTGDAAQPNLMEYYAYLLRADVQSIDQILYGTTNITDYFTLDPNETGDIYNFSKIILKGDKYSDLYKLIVGAGAIYPGITSASIAIITNATLNIKYNYFNHDGDGIITRESYRYGDNNIMELSDIGFCAVKNQTLYPHKSAIIDFRPYVSLTRSITTSQDPTDPDLYNIKSLYCPINLFQIENTYYANRVDNLYVDKFGSFSLETGTPSKEPTPPSNDYKKGMLIHRIYVPGYTHFIDDIKTLTVENKRYTMRDIGKLEKRIQNLEYYTTLSLLEQEANALTVVDADGFTREKMGIITDSFTSHTVGDTANVEYNVCMNTMEGYMTVPTKAVKLPIKQYTGNLVQFTSGNDSNYNTGLFQLPPTNKEIFIFQPSITTSIAVTGLDLVLCEGVMLLDPAVDDWVDTNVKPPLKVNLDGNSEAINTMAQALFNNNIAPFGTVYGDWTTIPGTFEHKRFDTKNRGHGYTGHDVREWDETRTADKTFMTTSTSEVDLGERITDINISHYIRPQKIRIKAVGLKPNTRFYIFFGNENIDEYCKYRNTIGTGSYINVLTQGTLPKTNTNGEVEIEFTVPESKFRTGEKQITVTDSETNDKNDKYTLMYATAAFASSGLTIDKQTTVGTVRNFEMQHTKEIEERHTVQERTWTHDPIAQTFFVNELQYPEGLFLESVDLMFNNKDENMPIKVEVRPTVNGFPDISRIHAGGVSIKNAADVKTTTTGNPDWTNSNHITNFKFDYPVYLPPGEHCIMIKTNSKKYDIWAAQMGKTIVGTTDKVTSQPELGVFFRSANATTWEPDGTVDLSFKLHKHHWQGYITSPPTQQTMEFIPSKTATQFNGIYNLYQNKFEKNTNSLTFETVNPNHQYVDFDSCKIKTNIVYDPKGTAQNVTFTNVKKDTNIILTLPGELNGTSDSTLASTFKLVSTYLPTNRDVMPIFDITKSGITFVRNMVDSDEISAAGSVSSSILKNETLAFAELKTGTLQETNPSTVRYLTRVVTLDEDTTARNIKVGLTAYIPAGSTVAVFVKTANTGSVEEFNNKEYIQMTYTGNSFISQNTSDYRAMDFILPEDVDLFNRFRIKICIFASNSAAVPKIKDMRAFAVI